MAEVQAPTPEPTPTAAPTPERSATPKPAPTSAPTPTLGVATVSGLGTATVDGVMSAGEWDGAGSVDFSVIVPEGGTTPGTVFVMNDANNLYLAIRFARPIVDPGNTASFEFDNNHSGQLDTGDDGIVFTPGLGFLDEVRGEEPPCPPDTICSFTDIRLGGTNDGAGAFSNDGTFTVYEFSHPLDSADDAHDFSLGPGDTVDFSVSIRMIAAGAEWPMGFGDTNFSFFFFPALEIS